MNKILRRLLVAALALSASHVSAHSNKTFLMPRSDGYNMPLRRATFTEAVEHRAEDRFGGNFQIGFFYEEATNRADIGKYFGPGAGKNKFTIAGDGTPDLLSKLYIMDRGANAANSKAEIGFNPSHRSYGVNFNYHQDLDKILNGLYFRVNLPVAYVENDMGLTVNGATAAATTAYKNFFAGKQVNPAAPLVTGTFAGGAADSNQAALTNALIDGKRSETGVADIELQLGYSFLRKEAYKASINLGLNCPTGNKAEGKYAFEPIYGQGKHWGFGAGADFVARIWGDEHQNFKFNVAADYRYLFEATEKRTLGILNDGVVAGANAAIGNNALGQYQLVGATGVTLATAPGAVPLANVLTQNVGVTPGSLVDGIVSLAYNNGGLTLDLGYNLYFREEESVKRKDAWVDTKYTYLNGTEQTTGNPAGAAVNAAQLDVNAAATPSQFTNKIYGQVGYIFRNWEYPVFVSGGAHYEFKNENSALENWGFNIKAGISF